MSNSGIMGFTPDDDRLMAVVFRAGFGPGGPRGSRSALETARSGLGGR